VRTRWSRPRWPAVAVGKAPIVRLAGSSRSRSESIADGGRRAAGESDVGSESAFTFGTRRARHVIRGPAPQSGAELAAPVGQHQSSEVLYGPLQHNRCDAGRPSKRFHGRARIRQTQVEMTTELQPRRLLRRTLEVAGGAHLTRLTSSLLGPRELRRLPRDAGRRVDRDRSLRGALRRLVRADVQAVSPHMPWRTSGRSAGPSGHGSSRARQGIGGMAIGAWNQRAGGMSAENTSQAIGGLFLIKSGRNSWPSSW